MIEAVQQLIKKAAVFSKIGDHAWAIGSLEKAIGLLTVKSADADDYACAGDLKRDIAEMHLKKKNLVPAVLAYMESSSFYEKATDIKASMGVLAKAAYLFIEIRDYWQALFQFERLIDYYTRRDKFKCSRLAHDACLCLLAHNQVEALDEIFETYRALLLGDKEQENITTLLHLHRSDKPSLQQQWSSVVFSYL